MSGTWLHGSRNRERKPAALYVWDWGRWIVVAPVNARLLTDPNKALEVTRKHLKNLGKCTAMVMER